MPDPDEVLPTGYLLDTSVFSAYSSSKHMHHKLAQDFLDNGPPSQGIPTFLSVVNLMELAFGIKLAFARDGVARPDLDRMLAAAQAYDCRSVDRHVVEEFASLRVTLASRFLPAKIRSLGKLGEIERWRNEITNEHLAIEECDLWLAAQAAVMDVTLVTLEKRFVRHQEITYPALRVKVLTQA